MTNPAIPILRALWALQRANGHIAWQISDHEIGRMAGLRNGRIEAFEVACNALTREQLSDAYTYLANNWQSDDIPLAAYIRALIEV